nr:hypothetical protein [Lachnospiraceae bacterium]
MEVNKKIIIVGAIIIGVLSIGIGTVLLRKPEKTEKPVKNEKTESKKAEIVINAETEYDSFEKVLDKATYAIENADYYELNKITYSISNIGNPMFFSTIKSNVKSTEVVDDRENCKLVKIFLDVTEPGESKLNKGENTKFFYVAKKCLDDKICKEWVISPFFDEVSDEKEAVYYTEDNTDWLECFYECTNFGFGFADDNTYAISKAELGSEFYIDLNNDNIKEKITIEKSMSGNRLYINKDQYTQCSIDFYNKIAFCDIDKEDNFIEIYNYSKLIRFDGKRPYEYLDLLSNINIDDIKGDKKLPVCL